jgi:hypothetical protein
VKKLVLLFSLLVVATAVKEAFDFFQPMAQAYRSYREEAEADVLRSGKSGRFRDIEGNIIAVNYRLESAELETDTVVRLVVVESVRFQRASEVGPLGNRRVAHTRQQVRMRYSGGRWSVAELVEEPLSVTELGLIEFEED